MIKIAVIREDKVPVDRRVPLTPAQAFEVSQKFEAEVTIQSSEIRVFEDEEYKHYDFSPTTNVADCDILLGVKEVPIENLLPEKTYLFFSHTIKEQAYNRELLQAILDKRIRLIDYECLVNPETNQRIVAFGRFAGIVGAYNSIWTFGKRYNLFNLRRAHECYDLEDLKTEYKKVKLPAVKIAITGGGRVAKGAMEVLNGMNILEVTPHQFIQERFSEPVFTQLNSQDYHVHKEGKAFNNDEFYENPVNYKSNFGKYGKVADILIAGAFWDPRAPKLFKVADAIDPAFKIRIVGDITCDIDGSIPSTRKSTTIDEPLYDFNPNENSVEPTFSAESNITVMAIDNLPCELPRDASESFGRELIDNVLPHLLGDDAKGVIKGATIAENGKLTAAYSYLQDFVDGES